mmetsp:Transcript_2503/g.2891  ORF Transcript_2503/g.2891 Transcript_2503/m.2891 type:complete len:480 (-) Transcript_2503:228-1667(-)
MENSHPRKCSVKRDETTDNCSTDVCSNDTNNPQHAVGYNTLSETKAIERPTKKSIGCGMSDLFRASAILNDDNFNRGSKMHNAHVSKNELNRSVASTIEKMSVAPASSRRKKNKIWNHDTGNNAADRKDSDNIIPRKRIYNTSPPKARSLPLSLSSRKRNQSAFTSDLYNSPTEPRSRCIGSSLKNPVKNYQAKKGKKRATEYLCSKKKKEDSLCTSDSLRASLPCKQELNEPRPFASSNKISSINGMKSKKQSLLQNSRYLAYSWEDLSLGVKFGTPMLNEYLAHHTPSASNAMPSRHITAQETLHIVNTLRLKTYQPPVNSPLFECVQRTRCENWKESCIASNCHYQTHCANSSNRENVKNGDDCKKKNDDSSATHETNPSVCELPQPILSNLYETMCAQDADDMSSNRRESHYLTSNACIDKLFGLENSICALKLREMKVMRQCQHLSKIIGPSFLEHNQIAEVAGFCKPDEKYMK